MKNRPFQNGRVFLYRSHALLRFYYLINYQSTYYSISADLALVLVIETKQLIMIQEEIVCNMLEKEIPDIAFDIENEVDPESYITGIKCFTNYTARLIETGRSEKVRRCFHIAEELLQNGTEHIKSVITSQFMLNIYPILKTSSVRVIQAKDLLQGHLLCQYRYSVSMDNWY